jgi:hypothetical protein
VATATDPRTLQKGSANGPGDRKLRLSVLLATGLATAFLVFLTVFLFRHANPMGDGMEMVGASAAFMFIFRRSLCRRGSLQKKGGTWRLLPFSLVLPPFSISFCGSKRLSELGIRSAPWD